MVQEPNRFFELLHSAEFEVCDARMVNESRGGLAIKYLPGNDSYRGPPT